MVIKPLKPPSDLNAIQGVCWKQFGWDGDNLVSAICLGDVWLAEDKNKNAGFLFSSVNGKTAWVDAVHVGHKQRGKGLATRLFRKMETVYRSRGIQKTGLYVRSDNVAQTLYFKLGYRVVGLVKNYYGKGIHAVEMSKTLRRKRESGTRS